VCFLDNQQFAQGIQLSGEKWTSTGQRACSSRCFHKNLDAIMCDLLSALGSGGVSHLLNLCVFMIRGMSSLYSILHDYTKSWYVHL
jgi:hypothetical protein